MNTPSPLEAVFFAALEKGSPQARAAYLDEACAGDPGLRRHVEKMLAAQAQASSFLEQPAHALAMTVDEPLAGEGPGTVIGPYRLLRQTGAGGMGAVFLAEQTRPVQRQVAVKVIKPGMDSAQVIARFEQERQALALMDHPNVARVLDAGTTESGLPYFIMEVVQGVPITQYCDDHRLTPRQRLALFLPVCHAVQHAHQKGIIHRDLKPSNVLVALYDGKPVPKVIDFGIAKATGPKLTERTTLTEVGQVVGTLEYMSPEQAGLNPLDIDTRSDIYALGVLLYELLTGTTPLDRRRLKAVAVLEVLRLIREEEPPRPSTRLSTIGEQPAGAADRGLDPQRLSRQVRGDLDWVVMKCLEKDRNRRYETANALARDLDRYLADEPVQACPPSAGYRLRKFARRNGRWLVAGGLVAASLLLGTAVSLALAVRASQAESETRQRMVAEEKARRQATAINDFLQTMLRSADPGDGKAAEYTLRQLLDEFSVGLTEQERFRDQPEVEAEIQATMGRAYRRLGISDKAERHLKAALDLRRRVLPPDDEKVAESLVDYAWGCHQQRRYPEAEARAREALAVYRQRPSPPGSVIGALWVLQRALMGQKRFEEAEAAAEEAQTRAAETPDALYPEMASILHARAEGNLLQGRYAEAEPWARQALVLHRRFHGDNHVETAWCLYALGRALAQQKQLPEAEVCFREAVAILRKHYGNDGTPVRIVLKNLKAVLQERGAKEELAALEQELPVPSTNPPGKYDADAKLWLGRMTNHVQTKQWSEALAAMRRAIVFNESSAGHQQRALGVECKRLAQALVEQRQYAAAEESARNALALLQPLLKRQPGEVGVPGNLGWCHLALADALAATGRTDQALPVLREALAMFDKAIKDFPCEPLLHRDQGHVQVRLGQLLEKVQQPGEAEVQFRAAIAGLRAVTRERPSETSVWIDLGHAQWELGDLLAGKKQVEEALRVFRESLQTFRQAAEAFPGLAYYRQETAQSHRKMGWLLGVAKRPQEAAECFRQATPLYARLAAESPDNAFYRQELEYSYGELANALKEAGQIPQAAQAYREAVGVGQKLVAEFNQEPTRWHLGFCNECLGHLLREAGRTREAETAYRDALAVWQKLVTDFNHPDRRWHLGTTGDALANLLSAARRYPESEQVCREALAVWQKLAADTGAPDHREHLARCYLSLVGILLQQAGQADHDARLPEADRKASADAFRARARRVQQEAEKRGMLTPENLNTLAWPLVVRPAPDPADAAWAVELARLAVERAPDDGTIVNTLGTAYYRADNWKAAIETLKEAEQLGNWPNFGHDAFFIAMAYGKLGDKEAAGKWFTCAVRWMGKNAPNDGELLRFRAEAAALLGLPEGGLASPLGKPQDDRDLYKRILEVSPEAAWAYLARGQVLQGGGEPGKAREDYARALEVYRRLLARRPNTPALWAGRAVVYAELGEWQKAAGDWQKAAALWEKTAASGVGPLVWYQLALARLGANDQAGYRSTCAEIVKRFAEKGPAPYSDFALWACVLVPDGVSDPSVVVAWAERLVAAQVDNPTAGTALGAALYRAGRFEEAARRLDEVQAALAGKSETRTSVAYPWYLLAAVHERLGHPQEARQWLEKANREVELARRKNVGGPPMTWNRRLTLELLRREGEASIKEPAAPPQSSKEPE